MTDKLIYVCSPYRGDTEANTLFARECCRRVFESGAVPVAPHLYFPQFCNDDDAGERAQGMRYALELLRSCDEVFVFGDRISEGMRSEIAEAELLAIPVLFIRTTGAKAL